MSTLLKMTVAVLTGIAAYYTFENNKAPVVIKRLGPARELPTSFDGWWDYAIETQLPKVTSFSIEAKNIHTTKQRIQPVILNGCRYLMVLFNPTDKRVGVLVQDPTKGDSLITTLGCLTSFDVGDYVGSSDVVGGIVRNYGLRSLI